MVHSLTKYLAGHGDVLGGVLITREEFRPLAQAISRTLGGVLGPFEAYLAMRGVKTFPLRMARQCASACRVASWLAAHPRIERVHFPGDPHHPDAAVARRLFADNLFGAMVSFEVKYAGREQIFRLLEALQMIVPATSLGDVHSMILYPTMSLAPGARAQASPAHGHPGQPVAAFGGNRGPRGHHRRPRAGIGRKLRTSGPGGWPCSEDIRGDELEGAHGGPGSGRRR